MSKFKPGHIISHKLFDYRGVILNVDATFQLTDEWYEFMAKSKPSKNEPWYHVLVNNETHMTYVAERNILPDHTGKIINHPLVPVYFTEIVANKYERNLNWDGDKPVPVENIGIA